MNEVTFFRPNHCLERGLPDLLHPFSLREELVTETFEVWVLDDGRRGTTRMEPEKMLLSGPGTKRIW